VSDYIVTRIHPDLVDFVPAHLDGMWLDRAQMIFDSAWDPPPDDLTVAVAVATGRFETRGDGEVAEVFEFRP
jgi:hypothetical protein